MSETFLRYVPADPYWQPSPDVADSAVSLLKAIATSADEVTASFEDEVRFYDPGENWSGVECSACGADAEEWWGDAMDTASADGFKDLNTEAPCCGGTVLLNDLRYICPAAFGRFALEARNPNITDTTEEQDRKMAECVGMPLRKIWGRV
ncbi:hypothetical protein [Rhizobium sp. CNPSo 3490]|uniref:hypothetical protein n=1 Tax=Rhizobium sp. CNPSo 3490 TaxID=3021407 RepID=UPI00254F366F|nr:hypothetical protein [Rhizobium sp. CNPSo 3490]MDK4736163.1 hypothetical protein [Rhizobium sp. CNPSo 3490]